MTYEEIIKQDLEPDTQIIVTVNNKYTYNLPFKLVMSWYKEFQSNVDFKIKEKIVCPICGGEMAETYTSKQYCYNCEQKLKGSNNY